MSSGPTATRYLLLAVLVGAVALLTCFASVIPGGPGRFLLLTYLGGGLSLAFVLLHRMRREARQLTDYDREIHGICPACGDDLRATPDRCPECGRPAGAGRLNDE